MECAVFKTKFFRPLCNCLSFTIEGNEMVITLVIALFAISRPPCVQRPTFVFAFFTMTARIWSIVIRKSINRMLGCRFVAHITNEIYEYMPKTGETLLLFYRSGSGRTESVTDLVTGKTYDSFVLAERELDVE